MVTKKKRILSPEERKQRREQQAFTRRIQTTFRNASFVYLPTAGKHRQFGRKKGELDQVFLFENVLLICEDTIHKDAKDHLKNKKLLFDEIAANKVDLIDWLKREFPDRFDAFDEYEAERYQVFFLYFAKNDLVLSDDEKQLYSPVRVVRPSTLSYFHKMAANIKHSARTDVFRFLELRTSDIGTPDSGGTQKTISTSIIYPTDNTGLKNGVRIVSFMMAAEMLLRNSYVLRKDNWQESIELYQRLIERERIQSIRKYLAEKQTTFINNIIVSLPGGVHFRAPDGNIVDVSAIKSFEGHEMMIPDEINSICVIDGQHRIYAHYEGVDSLEKDIEKLRKKFHLLVTGLIFPAGMSELDRRKFESELFLDINSNARPVPQDVLLFIETLKDPFSDLGIARRVLARMNDTSPFEHKFQLSLMDDAKIKIASIIKFALRYLVEITPDTQRPSLFHTWSSKSDREALLEGTDGALLERYIEYLATVLARYFSAVKAAHGDAWKDEKEHRLLSTTAINGFLIALRKSLPVHGVLDFHGYYERVKAVNTDFTRSGFPYSSSQYGKFSRDILREAFGIDEDSDPELDEQESGVVSLEAASPA